ncbi:hypothetical protein [Gimesia sp.]|uniref:hypothetical protein n=1 Tax=Gimesia sp. TaxID=2024833 RepID=UPI003A92FB6D
MPEGLEAKYPAIAAWIQGGWIELGDIEMFGFVAMAYDRGGIVYEDKNCNSLEECMESLERGLREYIKEHWGDEY